MEDGDVVVGTVADLPQLGDDPRLVVGVGDVEPLEHEPAPDNVLLLHTTLHNNRVQLAGCSHKQE